ncbi:MAG TPA: XrtB/PEP-CTERM-associated polysaccharide biosynthesis outer membrane protein EpsL [Burkholderiales bacterium]|nr:XrtB/PEP-CTERM-associated polysaccharide biosynthesis outer membrane protein EpsL [Burkholderiales bacterium]
MLSILSCACQADEWDVVNFHARAAYYYDSNLFRERNDDAGSDQYTGLTGGLSIDKPYSMQRFRLNGDFTRYEYNEFKGLDHDTKNYLLAWDWSLTPRLTGTLLSDQKQELADPAFDTSPDERQERNIRTSRRQRLDMNWWFHSNWHLLGEIGKEKRIYDKDIDDDESFQATRWGTGLLYESGAGRRIGFNYVGRDGNLSQSQDDDQKIDDEFDSQEYEVALVYPFGDASRIHAHIGYLRQDYPDISERDFSGMTSGLRLEWGLTAKLRISAGYERTLLPWRRDPGSYAKVDAWALGATWSFSAKQRLELELEQRHREQHGAVMDTIPPPTSSTLRNDHSRTATLNWVWSPILTTELSLGWFYKERNSNVDDFDYDAHGFSVSLQHMF